MNKITIKTKNGMKEVTSVFSKELYICEKCALFNGKYHIFTGYLGEIRVFDLEGNHISNIQYWSLDNIKPIVASLGFSIKEENIII